MPLLLADLIYSRDCKLNLRKNVDTTLGGGKQITVTAKYTLLDVKRKSFYTPLLPMFMSQLNVDRIKACSLSVYLSNISVCNCK